MDWMRDGDWFAWNCLYRRPIGCKVCGERIRVRRQRTRAPIFDADGIQTDRYVVKPNIVLVQGRYIMQHVNCTNSADLETFTDPGDSD